MGFTKMVNEIDSKEAARLGLQTRPLTTAVIQKHLEDVGIEPEFGTHSRMRGLSGGQKVKVVLAAAMWNNPHILVLDEPTNYLDRESLGALAGAIRNYGGGCLMISHNRGKLQPLRLYCCGLLQMRVCLLYWRAAVPSARAGCCSVHFML